MSRPGYVDKRGNAVSRKRRREWLLCTFDPDLGDGRARCRLAHSADCPVVVDSDTLSVDRIEPGGSYRRGNIQPACKPCQDKQGGLITAQGPNAAMIEEYRAHRDARDAMRESNLPVPSTVPGAAGSAAAMHQLEDADFAEHLPGLTFREWLVNYRERPPDDGTTPDWTPPPSPW